MPRNVRCVVFDLVGTLIYPDPPVADVYARIGQQHGTALCREEIAGRFREAILHAQWSDASHAAQRETWRGIVYQVFQMPAARGQLFEALWDYFAQPDAWRPFDDVMPAINALQERELSMAIGSNFDDRIEAICAALGLSNQVDGLFWSSQLGCAKPASEFFEQIAKRLQLPPSQLLMVGDNRQHDVLAARQAGWQALLIERRSRPGTRAESIGELCEVLQRL